MRFCSAVFFFTILFLYFHICHSEANVIELTDQNFEELTQISTGSTTGSWFIKFYAPWCSHCKAISKTWNELSDELKNRVNVAQVDVTIHSGLRKRFKIEGFPTLLFFKNGKMYDYKAHDRTLEAFKMFALETYKNTTPSDPPRPFTTFDYIADFVYESLASTSKVYRYAFSSFVIISITSFLAGIIFSYIVLKISTWNTLKKANVRVDKRE